MSDIVRTDPRRVVVWSTGGVGSNAIRAVAQRADLELVGVWVHTPEKVGRDAGELAGIGPLGIAATSDVDALIALRPECVVYAASGPERGAGAVPDYERLLAAGINVVTTTSTELVYPPRADDALRDRLSTAAATGGASLYASGIFPGFASDELALLLTTLSRDIRSLRVIEVSLNDHYPVADVMMDGLGFARPLDFEPFISLPGVIPMVWQMPIALIASSLGVELEEIRGRLEREVTDRDIEVAFGTVPAGTVGAVRTIASGIVDGREAIVVDHVIRMARDVAPDWPTSDNDATYVVSIEGDPDIECRLTLGPPQGHDAGEAAMTATAMRVVNSVPYVIDAAPGLLSSLDLPVTLPVQVFGAKQ
jgi:2,4-diaminopentanoate dehydrogenase